MMDRTRSWRSPVVLAAAVSFALACAPAGTAPPPACIDTCQSTGAQCGEVCGVSCGTCPGAGVCREGRCVCTPQCAGKSCTDSDGCGGTCGPCDADVTCKDCKLRLVRVDQTIVLGEISRATIALESTATGPDPRLADVRVAVDPPMELQTIEPGPPLQAAGKRLYRFTETNLPYFQLADGSFQLLVFSQDKALSIDPGRWLTMTFARPPGAHGPAYKTVRFHLVHRAQTLAPIASDDALQTGAWDAPLAISAEAQP